MKDTAALQEACGGKRRGGQSGFSFAELLICTMLLLVVSAAVFGVAHDLQRAGGYQAEVQSVIHNTRLAMQTVERYIRQAGNDPLGCGTAGITIVSPSAVRIASDLTGSAGSGNPDKGDPDGDTNDSGENVTIRYNDRTRSLEVVPESGTAQIVAGGISGLSFKYYDEMGRITDVGRDVRRIGVSIRGSSLLKDPQTAQAFGIELNCDIQILT
jgi:type II secretory pathway component PulJ